ncbi:hypothetical protein [Parapedobacter sp. 10938]|uniref:hypothetical protein n=1 Tax=Parapedobacter flavus TaxID=3110225 RepID=UPI002DBB9696|nr:hypothetical protein [Parapedobacter sp. 10938]MEC3879746.1 hypothetical protein [Parapedobacter sp. 10938]
MQTRYHTAYERIWAASEQIDPYHDTRWLNAFTYYSANLAHFLPLLATESHLRRFRQTVAYEQLGALDMRWFSQGYVPTVVTHQTPLDQVLPTAPGIVCTMHTGAHLHIAWSLLQSKIPLALLVSAVARRSLIDMLGQSPSPTAGPILIDAEKPGALTAVIRQLKAGINVLALIDGGGGIGPLLQSNAVKVPFLGQHMFVRSGIPYAAWHAEVPIYPVWAFRRQQGGSIDVYRHPPIRKEGLSKESYLRQSIGAICDHFAAYLLHYPEQWTNWWNLQQHMDATQCIRPPDRVWKQPFGVMVHADDRYAFDRNHYRLHPIR